MSRDNRRARKVSNPALAYLLTDLSFAVDGGVTLTVNVRLYGGVDEKRLMWRTC